MERCGEKARERNTKVVCFYLPGPATYMRVRCLVDMWVSFSVLVAVCLAEWLTGWLTGEFDGRLDGWLTEAAGLVSWRVGCFGWVAG